LPSGQVLYQDRNFTSAFIKVGYQAPGEISEGIQLG